MTSRNRTSWTTPGGMRTARSAGMVTSLRRSRRAWSRCAVQQLRTRFSCRASSCRAGSPSRSAERRSATSPDRTDEHHAPPSLRRGREGFCRAFDCLPPQEVVHWMSGDLGTRPRRGARRSDDRAVRLRRRLRYGADRDGGGRVAGRRRGPGRDGDVGARDARQRVRRHGIDEEERARPAPRPWWLLVLLIVGGAVGATAGRWAPDPVLRWGFVVYVGITAVDLLARPGFLRLSPGAPTAGLRTWSGLPSARSRRSSVSEGAS